MDVRFFHSGQEFVWESEKADANSRKHGIRFETACEAFFDPLLQTVDATDGDETREAHHRADGGLDTSVRRPCHTGRGCDPDHLGAYCNTDGEEDL